MLALDTFSCSCTAPYHALKQPSFLQNFKVAQNGGNTWPNGQWKVVDILKALQQSTNLEGDIAFDELNAL